jgi:long-chain fatty acid transport protein
MENAARRLTLVFSMVIAWGALPITVQGAGFAVLAQSGSAAGTAFSAGATAEDASALWYNAAAMGYLPATSFSFVANAIDTSFQFHNRGSTGAFGLPGANDSGNAGSLAGVPQAYFAMALNDRWRTGIAVDTPFGLKTHYDSGWRGQLAALDSKSSAYDIGPSVAFKVHNKLWFGGGLDWQRFSAELTNFAGPLGRADLKASDSSIGYNVGGMWSPAETLRIGMSYRSAIVYKLRGNASFSVGGGIFNSSARTELTVPDSLAISVFQSVLQQFELTGSVTWTRWNRLQKLSVFRTSPSALGGNGTLITTLPFDWANTVLVGGGVAYHVNADWKTRVGVAHDSAASSDATRTPRLPDQARWLVSVGVHRTVGSNGTVDLGFVHDFVKEATINDTVPGVPGTLRGTVKAHVNALSLQYNLRL